MSAYILVVASVSFLIYLAIIIYNFRCKAIYILLGNVLTLVALGFLVEICGQVYAYFHPSYKTLDFKPDKTLGWTLVPDSEFPLTGSHWYATELNTTYKTNSLGYHDLERAFKKPDGTVRIALLGDSMVEAKQVPFEKTAGALLEKKFNSDANKPSASSPKFEVLNFGVSAYGIGQSALTYFEVANKFSPDYVFIFVFDWHIWRTINRMRCSENSQKAQVCLHVRPSFEIPIEGLERLRNILTFTEFHGLVKDLYLRKKQNLPFPFTPQEYKAFIDNQKSQITMEIISKLSDQLEKEPLYLFKHTDYERFVGEQEQLIKNEFNGSRVKKIDRQIFILDLWSKIKSLLKPKENDPLNKEYDDLLGTYITTDPDQPLLGNANFPNFEGVIFINLKILEFLKRMVMVNHAKLILVDASLNLVKKGQLPAEMLSTIFEKFASVQGIDYIRLSDPLNKANKEGIATHWKTDGHFNETGNQIFAEAMYEFMTKQNIPNGSQ